VFRTASHIGRGLSQSRVNAVCLAAFLVVVLGVADTAQAQDPAPLSVEDALNVRSFGYLSPLAFSPDGTKVAYMVQENGKISPLNNEDEDEFYVRTGVLIQNQGSDIWISHPKSGETKNITGGRGANWLPSWSPDGRYLAFLSDRDGSGQAKLWIWDSSHDSLRLVTNSFIRASPVLNELKWTPDSKSILVTTVPGGMSLDDYVKKVWSPRNPESADFRKVTGSTVIVYEGAIATRTSNAEFRYFHDLVCVDITTGQTKTVVHGQWVGWYAVSPDGQRVAYAVPKESATFRRRTDLVVTHLLSMQSQVVASNILLAFFSWSPDGSWIGYGADGVDETSYDYYVAPAVGGVPHRISQLPHQPCCNIWQIPMWDRESQNYYFIHDGALWRASVSQKKSVEVARIPNRRITFRISVSENQLWTQNEDSSTVVIAHDDEQKRDGFYKIDLVSGQSTKLLESEQSYTGKWNTYLTTVSADARWLAYISEDAGHAPDLWVSDPGFRHPQQVSRLNPQFEKYTMGAARLIEWLSEEGERLHGALLLPSDYHAGERYPLLVWVYPSPLSDDIDRFGFGNFPGPFNMQLFATRGYAVLLPDARLEVGNRLDSLASSVLPGVNKAIELGVADPNRVGVFGHSQGGYSALAMIVKSNRFRGAVAASGWGDFAAYYGILRKDGSGYEQGQAEQQLGGNPWDHPLTYIENSPMYQLDRVATPLLLVHGGMDEDHPSFLFDQVFVGLRRLGKTVEYAKYEGESHAPADWHYANQLDLASRIIAWLDRYVSDPSR
jgi:dipeptidyl aminopeptidase/acylaminoacyl peptidase